MKGLLVKPVLREAVGDRASEELVVMFADAHALATQSFERRLGEATQSFERRLGDEIGKVRVDIANLKFDLLTWSFLFWIGQAAVLTAVVSALLGRMH